MKYLTKHPFICIALLSLGNAYAQSVVINGGNIRVDSSTASKASVTVNGNPSGTAKAGKNQVVVGGTDATVVNGEKKTNNVMADSGGKTFVNSDFSGQDLSRANYVGASFTNVEAVGTNFKGVDLSRAVLTNVDMSKADMRGANMTGAQMTNVEWTGALLDGAVWIDGRRCASGSTGRCK